MHQLTSPPPLPPSRLVRREREEAQGQLDLLSSDRRQLQDDKGKLLQELAVRCKERGRGAVAG